MKNDSLNNEIVKKINSKYPNLKILEIINATKNKDTYYNLKGKIKVQDNNGIIYLYSIKSLLYSKNKQLILQLVVNKKDYLQLNIKDRLSNIKIIGEYIGYNKPILVEDELEIQYLSQPSNLLMGKKPTIETAVNQNEAFVIKAKLIHGNKFDYSKIDYKNGHSKVIIICPKHGEFKQQLQSHLSGKGCRKCANEQLKFTCAQNGWDKYHWVNFCNKNQIIESKFYILHCYNDKEQFIKIGITSKELKERYLPKDIPYNYKIIKIILGKPDLIYDTEQKLKKQFKNFRYIPKQKFGGYTECFSELIMEPILKEVA